MAEAYKLLGSVVLGVGATTIYTVPGSTNSIIKLIVLKSAGDNQIAQINATGGAPIVGSCLLHSGEWADWEGSLTLGAAGVIQGQSTTAGQVTASAYGLEIT